MAQKVIQIHDVGPVTFYKRRNARNIRIRINGTSVKVSLPSYVPYKTAEHYVTQKKAWIIQNVHQRRDLIHGDVLQTGHRLFIRTTENERFISNISSHTITVSIPEQYEPSSDFVQKKIRAVINKVLKTKAEEIIIPLTRQLSEAYKFEVASIQIKNLISRWGSCSNKKDLTFSMYLIQLPKEYIEYVVFHELAHTVHLNHSRDFWNLVASYAPSYKQIRKELKNYSPDILVH